MLTCLHRGGERSLILSVGILAQKSLSGSVGNISSCDVQQQALTQWVLILNQVGLRLSQALSLQSRIVFQLNITGLKFIFGQNPICGCTMYICTKPLYPMPLEQHELQSLPVPGLRYLSHFGLWGCSDLGSLCLKYYLLPLLLFYGLFFQPFILCFLPRNC